MMTDRIPSKFAANGNRTAIPATNASGYINWDQGYTQDYARRIGQDPNAKAVERAQMNWILGALTENANQWQNQAIPDWRGDAGMIYEVDSIVRASNSIFRCVQRATNNEPVTNAAFWEWVPTLVHIRQISPMPAGGGVPTAEVPTTAQNANALQNGTWEFSDTVAAASQNLPVGICGMLESKAFTDSGNTRIIQRYTNKLGSVHVRAFFGSWQPWQLQYGTTAKPSPIDIGALGRNGDTGEGNYTFTGHVTVSGTIKTPAIVLRDNCVENWSQDQDDAAVSVSYYGYGGGVNRFRNFIVWDGKTNPILNITGASKLATFMGEVATNSVKARGTSAADSLSLQGQSDSGGATIVLHSATAGAAMEFWQKGAVNMALRPSGNLLVGVTTANETAHKLQVGGDVRATGSGTFGGRLTTTGDILHLNSGASLGAVYGGVIEGRGVTGKGGNLRLGVMDNGAISYAITILDNSQAVEIAAPLRGNSSAYFAGSGTFGGDLSIGGNSHADSDKFGTTAFDYSTVTLTHPTGFQGRIMAGIRQQVGGELQIALKDSANWESFLSLQKQGGLPAKLALDGNLSATGSGTFGGNVLSNGQLMRLHSGSAEAKVMALNNAGGVALTMAVNGDYGLSLWGGANGEGFKRYALLFKAADDSATFAGSGTFYGDIIGKRDLIIGDVNEDAERFMNIIGAGAARKFGIQLAGSPRLWTSTAAIGITNLTGSDGKGIQIAPGGNVTVDGSGTFGGGLKVGGVTETHGLNVLGTATVGSAQGSAAGAGNGMQWSDATNTNFMRIEQMEDGSIRWFQNVANGPFNSVQTFDKNRNVSFDGAGAFGGDVRINANPNIEAKFQSWNNHGAIGLVTSSAGQRGLASWRGDGSWDKWILSASYNANGDVIGVDIGGGLTAATPAADAAGTEVVTAAWVRNQLPSGGVMLESPQDMLASRQFFVEYTNDTDHILRVCVSGMIDMPGSGQNTLTMLVNGIRIWGHGYNGAGGGFSFTVDVPVGYTYQLGEHSIFSNGRRETWVEYRAASSV